ncbi:MAG: DNA starvation/stationary phase protection protein [Siphonobacter aquaeclarae]|jgi:starvation-inducible DNA-binding protein|nr:DNA starvation/stationary phase protection protein [Siphonobacter aquaeclarae]
MKDTITASANAAVELGISDANIRTVTDILNTLLADEHVLYVKTRNYHWNVVGPSFIEYHEFFERLYNELAEQIDEIAERVRALGQHPIGSMAEFLKFASLKETKHPYNEPLSMIGELLHDHQALSRWLRDQIEITESKTSDTGTTDFLTGLLRYHEKVSWMLRSYLS